MSDQNRTPEPDTDLTEAQLNDVSGGAVIQPSPSPAGELNPTPLGVYPTGGSSSSTSTTPGQGASPQGGLGGTLGPAATDTLKK